MINMFSKDTDPDTKASLIVAAAGLVTYAEFDIVNETALVLIAKSAFPAVIVT